MIADISCWQGHINFKALKTSGVSSVIIRSGFGIMTDLLFENNITKCYKHKVEILGLYHVFSFADFLEMSFGTDEGLCTFINNALKMEMKKDTVLFLEILPMGKEINDGILFERFVTSLLHFANVVKSAGYLPGIYCNKFCSYKIFLEDSRLNNEFVIWMADWSGREETYDRSINYLQYTCNGKVKGIQGEVSMSRLLKKPVKADDIINIAKKYLEVREGSPGHKRILELYNNNKPLPLGYVVKQWDDWCDTFVSAVFIEAGAIDLIGQECGCERHIQLLKQRGIWRETAPFNIKVGDIILYNWDTSVQPNNGFADHIGIVIEVHGSTVKVIEGNYFDKVGIRTINVNWGYIRGVASPKYDVSATIPLQRHKNKNPEIIAREVIQGKWGNGVERKNNIESAGYDYGTIQQLVNDIIDNRKRKSVTDVAKEVINGHWGNGESRKNSILNAGYNYDEVQAEVNRLVADMNRAPKEIIRQVLNGEWGNGVERKKRLVEAGYDYDKIQNEINKRYQNV